MKKKNGFLSAAITIVICSGISKLLGMFYRVKLGSVIGTDGMAYYQAVFPIYALVLMLLVSGIPTAVSRFTAQSISTGSGKKADTYFYTAIISVFFTGCFLSSLLMLFSGKIAGLLMIEEAGLVLAVLAPSVLFSAVSAVIRGYMQGMGSVLPTAFSGMIEQTVKLGIGIYLSGMLIEKGFVYGAAGAAAGVMISDFVSLVYVIYCYIKTGKERKLRIEKPEKSCLFDLVSFALPVTVGSCIMPISASVDSFAVTAVLRNSGYTAKKAAELYGILTGFAMPVANMPGMLISALSCVTVPKITSYCCCGKKKTAVEISNKCICAALIMGITVFLPMFFFPGEITSVLYGSMPKEKAKICAEIIRILAFGEITSSAVQVLTGIMHGIGRADVPVRGLVYASATKTALNVILCGKYGITGAAVSSDFFYIILFINSVVAFRNEKTKR